MRWPHAIYSLQVLYLIVEVYGARLHGLKESLLVNKGDQDRESPPTPSASRSGPSQSPRGRIPSQGSPHSP